MKTSGTNLSVWSGDGSAFIKIAGRANFGASIEFKNAVYWLCEKGFRIFKLDLTDCLLMDSTFAGVLAGLGRTFEPAENPGSQNLIEILNPNDRISDLLDNLGVKNMFHIVQGTPPNPADLTEVPLPAIPPSDPEAFARACYDAHKDLIKANPTNAEKFKDVTSALSEEIERYKRK